MLQSYSKSFFRFILTIAVFFLTTGLLVKAYNGLFPYHQTSTNDEYSYHASDFVVTLIGLPFAVFLAIGGKTVLWLLKSRKILYRSLLGIALSGFGILLSFCIEGYFDIASAPLFGGLQIENLTIIFLGFFSQCIFLDLIYTNKKANNTLSPLKVALVLIGSLITAVIIAMFIHSMFTTEI